MLFISVALLQFQETPQVMRVSAASPGGGGGKPLGNPGGAHGLGRGFVAKMFPGDRGIGALLHFMASLLRDLPTGFANGLLSQFSSNFNVPWHGIKGVAKLPRDLHVGFEHQLLS